MPMQRTPRVRKAFQLVLAFAVLALFAGVPFVNFYRLNLDSLAEPSRMIESYLMVLAAAIVLSLVAKSVVRNAPMPRIFMVAAIATFMAFYYPEIKHAVGGDRAALAMACWAFVALLLGIVVGKFSDRKTSVLSVAIVGVVYMVPAATALIKAQLYYRRVG